MSFLERKVGLYNLILLIIFFVSFTLFVVSGLTIQGHVTEGDIPSNVSILKSLAISFSPNLSSGIYFGEVNFLPATNVQALGNNLGAGNSTTYYVAVSSDGNVPVDLCLRANSGLKSAAGDEIGLGNETYFSNVGYSNETIPSLINETSLSLNYSKSFGTIPQGNYSFLRFWLDIPAAQPAGQYNNSVFFKGVEAGLNC